MTTDEEFAAAEQRGRDLYANVPHVVQAAVIPSIRRLLLRLSDGLELALRLDDFGWMSTASEADLQEIELSASGFEVYFPRLDEGFWVPDMLEHLLNVRRFLKVRVEEELADYERLKESNQGVSVHTIVRAA